MPKLVYEYRSRMLHDGTPFPVSMLERHWVIKGVHIEFPLLGTGSSTRGGTWLSSELPISLHAFHYIARHVLLNWWDRELSTLNLDSHIEY